MIENTTRRIGHWCAAAMATAGLWTALGACSSDAGSESASESGGAAGTSGSDASAGGASAAAGAAGSPAAGGNAGEESCTKPICASEVAVDATYPAAETPLDVSYEDWVRRWSEWTNKLPKTGHPKLGGACDQSQDGPVWFLDTMPMGCADDRPCTVPSGWPIFVPVGAVASYVEPEEPADECQSTNPDDVCGVTDPKLEKLFQESCREYTAGVSPCLEVDGKSIANLEAGYFFVTGFYQLNVHPGDPVAPALGPYKANNCGPYCAEGEPRHVLYCGWYAMLKPLPAGEHSVRSSLIIDENSWREVTYKLTVE
jgi:hypothetical protein